MPELPEVEVVKRSLKRKIRNLIIKKVKINDSNLRYKINRGKFFQLVGKRIIKIARRSKFLVFDLDKDISMLAHLGMTGKFFFVDKKNRNFKTSFYYNLNDQKDLNYNRVIFFFRDNQKLIYNDVRKFGFIKIFKKKQLKNNLHFKNLGPEPLEKSFNFKYLKRYFTNRNRAVKDILMDQKCVSGLGNIYVNEILFSSGIRPNKKAKLIKSFEIEKILKNTKRILKNSIKLGGSSIKDFSSDDGKKGSFQQYFKVYGQKGKKCSTRDCSLKIIRRIISNRSSFFCRNCQK